jgi:hypothetical protein
MARTMTSIVAAPRTAHRSDRAPRRRRRERTLEPTTPTARPQSTSHVRRSATQRFGIQPGERTGCGTAEDQPLTRIRWEPQPPPGTALAERRATRVQSIAPKPTKAGSTRQGLSRVYALRYTGRSSTDSPLPSPQRDHTMTHRAHGPAADTTTRSYRRGPACASGADRDLDILSAARVEGAGGDAERVDP